MFSKRVDGKSQPRQARRDVTNRAEVFVYCERLGVQHYGGQCRVQRARLGIAKTRLSYGVGGGSAGGSQQDSSCPSLVLQSLLQQQQPRNEPIAIMIANTKTTMLTHRPVTILHKPNTISTAMMRAATPRQQHGFFFSSAIIRPPKKEVRLNHP